MKAENLDDSAIQVDADATEQVAAERGERIASSIQILLVLMIFVILWLGLVSPAWNTLAQISSETPSLFYLVLLFQIILFVSWIFVSFAVPAIVGIRMDFPESGDEEFASKSLVQRRKLLFPKIQSSALTWLDEYWEIAISSSTLGITI